MRLYECKDYSELCAAIDLLKVHLNIAREKDDVYDNLCKYAKTMNVNKFMDSYFFSS